jgi:hypothetical protein
MSSFMNQDAQRDFMYFVTDCLQFYSENAPSVWSYWAVHFVLVDDFAHQLLRFRLGCHNLPCVVGRRTGIPKHLRHCALSNQGVRDEKHLVFECIAFWIIFASRFQKLFWHGCAISSFMNQDAQRDVMYFVTDCLQFHYKSCHYISLNSLFFNFNS